MFTVIHFKETYLNQRQIQDFLKGGAWGVVGMAISYLEIF